MELMSKNKLKGKNIAVYFGTFSPLHTGHQQDIYKALATNDGLVLVVSGYTGDRGDKIGLSLYRRFRYLREAFADEPSVVVAMLDEDEIPRYPDGWTPWLNKLQDIVSKAVVGYDPQKQNIKVYMGESEYQTEFKKRLPEWEAVKFDRKEIPISATMIRSNPFKYWNLINRIYRRHFTKKVLIAGSASTGKSTLVRRLARSINAPFSEEYARLYEEKYNLTDSELTVNDYSHFYQGQYDANQKEINNPSNQGIVFCDTDAIVTHAYSKLYLKKEEHDSLEDIYNNTVKNEEWDLILIIPPITKYIDDGFRNMEWEDSRYDYHNEIMK